MCCSSSSGYVVLVAGNCMVQPHLATVSDQCVSAQQVQCCNYECVTLFNNLIIIKKEHLFLHMIISPHVFLCRCTADMRKAILLVLLLIFLIFGETADGHSYKISKTKPMYFKITQEHLDYVLGV